MILSFIDKILTGTWSLALFLWNAAPVAFIAVIPKKGELASRSPTTLAAIDISDFIYIFEYDRSSPYLTVNQWKIKISPKITQIF